MEFDYDCLQRHQIRVVHLPSDGVDPARLSGPCRVYRLGRPMDLAELNEMPRELQKLYLQRLRQHGGTVDTAAAMLGLSPAALSKQLRSLGVALDRPDPKAWSSFVSRGKEV